MLIEAEKINKKHQQLDNIQVILSTRALTQYQMGGHKLALNLLKEGQQLCLQLKNNEALRQCYNAQAKNYLASSNKFWLIGRYHRIKANELYQASEQLARQENNQEGIMLALANQGIILLNLKQPSKRKQAEPMIREAYEIALQLELESSTKTLSKVIEFLEEKSS